MRDAVPQVPDYAASRHGQLAMGASTWGRRPAVCTDCHGIHPQANGHPDTLLLRRPAIPATCGRCHPREYAEYATSAHGLAALRGDPQAAVCTDCHTEHRIVSPASPSSSVYAANLVATCSRCHANTNLVRLHSLPAARVSSYQHTYHGVANRYGDLRVANCVSCHGAHNILPASDPASTVNPRNVPETCAGCHPGAQSWVAVGQVHVVTSGPQARGLWYVGLVYRIFVFVTLAIFIGYILLELGAYARQRRGERRHRHDAVPPLPAARQDEYLLRLTPIERAQHYVLLATFVLLSVSGVVLLIPDSEAARLILALSGGMTGRALVHRVAAAGLLALGLFHVVWVITTRRGREVFRHLLPRLSDVAHAIQTGLYLFGLSSTTARFGRFTFVEKFEYWAVSWGMVSMGLTGVVMTFTDWSLRYLPRWVWEACKIVHTWEALLAILTIAIWHLYHALWRPGGPNWSWVTGYLTPEQLAREHPLEYERALASLATAPEDSSPVDRQDGRKGLTRGGAPAG
jgi:formate dehydrogenase gamma subunit